MFEEKYLANPIGQILYAEYGEKVVSELNHPLLTEHTVGRGKRPKMDFAVVNDGNVTLSLESKWAGNTPLKIDDIIWDLVRLELLASHYLTKSIFLLAGKKKKLQALFASNSFLAPHKSRSPRPILKTGEYKSLGLRIDNPPEQRINVIKRLVQKFPDIEMPAKVSSGQPFVFPTECSNNDFQVYVWEIAPAKHRTSFLAREHNLYA